MLTRNRSSRRPESPSTRFASLLGWLTALLVAGWLGTAAAQVIPADLDPAAAAIIPVTASDNQFESHVLVTWPRSTAANVFYRIKRGSLLLSVVSSQDSSYKDFSGTPGLTYNYCVAQINVATGDTIDLGCNMGGRIINAPTGASATDDSYQSSIVLTWTDNSFIETGYDVFRDNVLLETIAANSEGYVDDTAIPGVTYNYCVAARDGGGNLSIKACNTGRRAFIQAPGSVQATDGQDPARVLVTWTDATDLEVGYIVRRKLLPAGTPVVLDTTNVNVTEFADSTALSGTVYQYCVSAVDTSGVESAQVCDQGNRGILAPPQNVVASDNLFDDRVEIRWQDVAATENGFQVFRNIVGQTDTVLVGSVAANVTELDDVDATPGVQYRYCVRAFTDLGAHSARVCDNGRRALVLAPLNVQASDGTYEDVVEITWESEATAVVLFKIFRNGTPLTTVPGTARSVLDAGVASGVVHTYAVSAVSAFEDESPQASNTGFRTLKAPGSVAAGDFNNEVHVMVTWTDNSQAEAGYRIYRRIGAASPTLIGSRSANRTAYLDSTGTPGQQYEYFVAAYDALGNSASVADFGGRLILPPTDVSAGDGDFETQIRVEWVDNARFETGYRVYRRLVGATDSTLAATLPANSDEYTDTNILFGRSYEYIVQAYDAYGRSLPARDTGYTVIQPPGTVLASDTYSDRVVVSWIDASAIEDGYRVYRNNMLVHTSAANATAWVDSAATLDVTYDYCVKAFDLNAAVYTYSAETCDTGTRPTAAVVATTKTKLLTERIAASGLSTDDQFGSWLAVDGDYAAVGAPHDIVNTTAEGKVVIFKWNGSDWVQSSTIQASVAYPLPILLTTAGNEFGSALALDGDRLVVGAPGADVIVPPAFETKYGAGAVYILQRDTQDAWSVVELEIDPDPETAGRFGDAVDIDGTALIVGSSNKDNVSGASGAAWIYFENTTNEWTQDATYGKIDVDFLTSRNFPGGGKLGWSVGVSDGYFLIGHREANPGFTGGVVQFRRASSSAVELDDFQIPGTPASALFGESMYVEGNMAIIGAPGIGRAYIATRGAQWWAVGQELAPSDGTLYFGRSAVFEGNRAIIGAQNSYFLFEKDPDSGLWVEVRKILVDGNGTGYYSKAGLSGNEALFAAPANGSTGAVFTDFFLQGPSQLTASDAAYRTRIQVKWKDNATTEDGFRLYRDGQLIEEFGPNATAYSDVDVEPGRIYEYCVEAFNSFVTSGQACDYGWIPPDGSITGRVATRNGTAVEGVEVCLDPSPIRALLFDGVKGALKAPAANIPDLTAFTVEFWARTGDGRPGTALSYATGSSVSAIRIRNFDQPLLQVGADSLKAASALNLDDNSWHHYAWTWQGSSGAATLYVDGVERATGTLATGATIQSDGFLVLGQEQAVPGGGFSTARAFQGQLDDLRIWNVVRSAAEIAASRAQKLSGAEAGLALYWPMDEGEDIVVADLSAGATYANLMDGVTWTGDTAPLTVCGVTDDEGNYALNDIRYGASTTFRVSPMFPGRQFEPAFKTITLNTNSPVQNELAFTDISSYSLEGFVRFVGTDPEGQAYACPVGEVEILVDGVVRGQTGPDGRYSFPVDLGNHEISARLGSHVFSPLKRTLFVDRDQANLNFDDLTRNTLSGVVAGGCGLPIGDLEYEVRTESGCLVFEGTSDATYSHLLPAQKYSVRVVDITLPSGSPLDRADILEFFEEVGPKPVDLGAGNAVFDFIYHAPLVVVVEGFEDPSCAKLIVPGNPTPLPAVPVIDQGESVPLTIRVFEDYGSAGLCPVDSGTVTVFDEIIDEGDTPVRLEIRGGEVRYTTIANTPNVFAGRRDADGNDRSYQKPISFVAEVEGQSPVTTTLWTVVTGHRPRVASFTSISEGIPQVILRDPPGDASSSFLEEGTTICNTISDIGLEQLSTGVNFRAKVGLEFSKGTPFFMTRTRARVETENNFRIGFEATQDDGVEICATTTERISTSGSDQFVDNRGDVFMGIALNLVFAKTDVVEVTETGGNCVVQRSESVTIGGDGFETTYLYTAEHIRSVLIPTNLELAELTGEYQYQSAAESWQDHLDLNDSLKTAATFVQNRSFSAGADFDYSASSDTSSSFTATYKAFTNNELSLGFNFDESGSGTRFQAVIGLAFEYTRSEASDSTTNRTVGYTLSDDDIYDFFSVDISDDAYFGTPVFDVPSGRSSCPWEPWRDPTTGEPRTQPRDGALLSLEPPVQLDVDPDAVAEFVLTMTNDSPADETREYFLMPVQTANPGGASIFVGGDTFIQLPFFINAGESRTVSLTVARGPVQYNYEDLQLVMIPTCEFDYWRATGFAQLADTVTFTVRFKAPCSDITLFEPGSDWQFNAQDVIDDANQLRLTLKDFELQVSETDSLQSVGAEYRRVGTEDWFPIAEIGRSNLALNGDGSPRSVEILWNVANVVDGSYELRGFTRCQTGRAFSGSATGTIDRKSPVLLGNPQPADSVLSLGEEISITFNEPIDCNSVNGQSVRLYRVKEDGTLEDLESAVACGTSEIVIVPENPSLALLEGKKLRVRVEGVTDRQGNPMVGPGNQPFAQWGFDVRQQVFAWSQLSVSKTATYLDPGSIGAELVNGSGLDLDYAITGLPAWLTASPASGSIGAAGSEPIQFDIQPDLAIGSYSATATATAMDGAIVAFVTPLAIKIDVVCVPPGWAVNPADFEQSMTLVAQVSVGGSPATTRDIVAAFVGNQLRGVGSPQTVPGRSDSLLYLTVFSNRVSGETVRFQVFDQSACFVYNSASKTYPFLADGRTGSPSTPEVIAAAVLPPGSPQVVPVDEGWTWISFNRLSALDMTVNGVLGDLNPAPGDLLKSQSAFSQFDEAAGWVGNVSVFNNLAGYMIRMSEAGQVTLEGTPVPPTTTNIPVVTGWNWIGYIPDAAMETNTALAGLAPVNGDVIKGQAGFAQFVKSGSTNRWFGSLATMEPGKAYKLYLTNASNTQNAFRYPNPPAATSETGPARTTPVVNGDGTVASGPAWQVDPHLFQYNMTVTGTLQGEGLTLRAGDVVAAFVGDELRGTALVQELPHLERGLFFLMVHGNAPSGESLRFEFYDSLRDELFAVEGGLSFEADRVVGDPGLPWVGTVTGQAVHPPAAGNAPRVFQLAQNMPNPPNPSTTIRYALPTPEHVRLKVYDVAGREVMTLVDGRLPAGWHDVTLDGQILPSGLYFYRLEAGAFVQTQKMVIVK